MNSSLRVGQRLAANPLIHTVVIALLLFFVVQGVGPSSYYGYLITIALLYGVAAIGLDVPAGMLGQLSLAQGASMAVGAYTTGILITKHGWPLLPALFVACVFGFAVGAIMAIPAGRLGLIGLAIVSLGLTLVVSDFVTANASLTGGPNGMLGIVTSFAGGSTDLGASSMFTVVLVTCALAYLVHWRLRLSTFGRACLAVRDDDLGATALGISGYRHVVIGFGVGSGIGAVAGGLYAVVASVITPDLFGIQLSILILLMVIFGGAGTRLGPVLGAAVIGVLPIVLSNDPTISVYLYGGILIVSMRILPRGLIRRTGGPVPPRALPPADADTGPLLAVDGQALPSADSVGVLAVNHPAPLEFSGRPVLEVSGVSRSFDGVRALKEANLSIHPGEVVAIIGSNGSGKTTLLNVVCGYYRAESGGSIQLAGHDITTARPRVTARRGISRTFQVPKVFPSLSIDEHLALARARATQRDPAFDRIAMEFLASTGVLDSRRREARVLSQGHLRFLEVGVAALRGPHVLLLDEQAAGLSQEEMIRLGELIRQLAAHGVAVGLIEHHLDWVRSIADRVIVMHLGEQIWTGSPDELTASNIVRNAYLMGVADG